MSSPEKIKNTIASLDYVAGLDEAGAGPLASSLFVASVILPRSHSIKGLADSKAISAKKRDGLFDKILDQALEFSIVEILPQDIDRLNIFQARMEGFRRAASLLKKVEFCLIDGNKVPENMPVLSDCCIKGDALFECISAASILAKVSRDRLMEEQDLLYPQYGFAKHKGYGTADHIKALMQYGPSPIHRFSYKPVQLSAQKFSSEKNI